MQSSTSLSVLVFVTSWFAFAPMVNAQGQSQPSAPSTTAPGSASPSVSIPDDKLDAAAAAVKSVSMVKRDYEQRIAQAPDPDRSRIVEEANQAITKAVTDQGLTVTEYSAILQVAQNDPTVGDKILQRLK